MKPPKKKRLAAYLRVSSEQQKNDETIESQRNVLKDLLGRMGILDGSNGYYEFVPYDPRIHTKKSPSFFEDEAFNAEKIDEDQDTALWDLLERVKMGLVDTIAVYSVDRIFRSESEVERGKVLDILREQGVSLFYDGCEHKVDIALIIQACFAAEKKTQDLRKMHDGKISKLLREGGPPSGREKFGFRWLNTKPERRWEIVSEEFSLIRWVGCLGGGIMDKNLPPPLKLALREKPLGLSTAEIVSLLNQHGFNLQSYFIRNKLSKCREVNPKGLFTDYWIDRISREEAYTGTLTFRLRPTNKIRKKVTDDEKQEYTWPVAPVFTKAEWEMIQRRRLERSCYGSRNVKVDYLLKDLITCAHCGKPMGARQSRKHNYNNGRTYNGGYYTCNRKQIQSERRRCPNRACTNYKHIDEKVWNEVVAAIKKPESIRALSADAPKNNAAVIEDLEASLRDVEKQITDADSQVDRLNTLMVSGALNALEAVTQKERIARDRRQIMKTRMKYLAEIKSKKEKDRRAPKPVDLKSLLASVEDRIDNLTFSEKRTILSVLIAHVQIDRDRNVHLQLRPIKT